MEYMMLKNALFRDIHEANVSNQKDSTLIHFHLKMIDKNQNNDYRNFNNFLYLLEEFRQHSYEDSENNNNKFMKNLLIDILKEEPEEFDSKNELKLPRKHVVFGLLMVFLNYYVSKNALYSLSDKGNIIYQFGSKFVPFFNLISLIMTRKEDLFVDTFAGEYIKMEESYKKIFNLQSTYNHDPKVDKRHFYEKFSAWFCVILIYAAIKTKQKKIVDKIFEYNNFLIFNFEFPSNMKVEDIHKYVFLKMLQNKYELSRENLPKTWISYEVMKEFLDSCIKFQNNFYKIDFRFMLPFYNYDKTISNEEEKEKFIYKENYNTIKYILDDNNLKPIVTHPVMEIIIRVKYQKYARMFFWHFLTFMTYYVLPSIGFACSYHTIDSIWFSLVFITIAFIYISISTSFIRVVNSCSNQSVRMSDINDKCLIWVSFYILALTFFDACGIHEMLNRSQIFGLQLKGTSTVSNFLITSLEAINIIFIIISTTFFLPFFKFPIYMKSFRKVLTTLFQVFTVFLPLIISCATLLFIIFNKNSGTEKDDFHTFSNSIMNYVKMYLLDIDIDTGNTFKWIVVTLVIILTISQTNLIFAIIIGDIEKLMEESEKYNLIVLAEKYAEVAKIIKEFKTGDLT